MHSGAFADYFGDVVRKHRKAKALTQEDLAEKAGIASKMVSLIERFERNASLNIAHSIAEGLDVPFWQLVKETEELKLKARKKKEFRAS